MRWLVAIVADTGMRLAEAAGLLREDIFQDEDGQWVARIVPHPWRSLKTESSKRLVPLSGQRRGPMRNRLAESSHFLGTTPQGKPTPIRPVLP